MLGATADGKKLPPFIVLKGKRIPQELRGFTDAIITVSDNGWMNSSTTVEWLKRCWGTFAFGRRLLVWDAFRAHRTDDVMRQLKTMRTDTAMIPGGCTKLLQAPDVSWMKPFKAAYVELYEKWMQTIGTVKENQTKAGNARPPSKLLMCHWVVAAWKAVNIETIKRSFQACGLTTSLQGDEDGNIHAVKQLGIDLDELAAAKETRFFDIEDEVSSSDESVFEDSDSDSSSD